jgi:predicted DNA-binding protein YlxM (UPF0122 family)
MGYATNGTNGQARAEIQKRRMDVERMYLQKRMIQQEIADELGVSQPTIANDIKAIKAEWKRKYCDELHEYKKKEIAELELLEGICLEKADGDDGSKWIQAMKALKERKSRMLGLDAPIESNVKVDMPLSKVLKRAEEIENGSV